VGEVIYGSVTPYAGQKIAKNFRFEVWSTNSSPAVQVNPIQIYTSVLGGVDYRYGADFQLIGNDTPVTVFGASDLASVTCPTTNLIAHWRANTGFSAGTWIDSVSGFILTPTGSVVTASPANLNGQKVVDISAGSLSATGIISAPLSGPAFLFVILAQKSAGSGSVFFQFNDAFATSIISIASSNSLGGYSIDGYAINDPLATVYPTFRMFQLSQYFASINNFNGIALDGITIGGSGNNINSLYLTQAPVYIAEILLYSSFASQAEVNQFNLYLQQRYLGSNIFALPLTFPANSSPTINVI